MPNKNLNETKQFQESVLMHGMELAESRQWRDYTTSIREGYRRKNKKSIPNELLATTAQLLENTRVYATRMDETTRQVNLGNFIDYGFDVISAVVPSLIAPEIMSVQALQAKHGAIFYLQYLYGTNKGGIKAGDVMNSPFTGAANDFNYSNDKIDGEVIGTGDASKTSFNTTLAFLPVYKNTAGIYVDGTLVATAGEVEGDTETLTPVSNSVATVKSATINLETGAVEVTFAAAVATDKQITVEYRYNMDMTTTQFSQVDLDLKSVSIEAFPRKLRARKLVTIAA